MSKKNLFSTYSKQLKKADLSLSYHIDGVGMHNLEPIFKEYLSTPPNNKITFVQRADHFNITGFEDGSHIRVKRLSGTETILSFNGKDAMNCLKDMGLELRGLKEMLEDVGPKVKRDNSIGINR